MYELSPRPEEIGQRLDRWLAAHFPLCPKAAIKDFLNAGKLFVNGRPCAKGDRVRAEVTYQLAHEPVAPTLQANADLPLDILYEDDALLAVNKPAGMNCQPNAPDEIDTLGNALLAHCPSVAGVGDGPLTCGVLHRIDGETSGLVLVAKTQEVYDDLRAQFAAHTVEKHYLALVSATLHTGAHLVHDLAHNPRCPGRMIDAAQWHDAKRPMRAVTDYTPLRHLRGMTLLDVTIFTGVTHQIRAQLSLNGTPILGDKRYGGQQWPGFNRHFLHAHTATFHHSVLRKPLTLTAPLTPELQQLVATLSVRA